MKRMLMIGAAAAVLCGLVGSHPGSALPSATSGAPPSGLGQLSGTSLAVNNTVAKATLPFLISPWTVPLPVVQPRLSFVLTVNVTLPVSLPEKPTDNVFASFVSVG